MYYISIKNTNNNNNKFVITYENQQFKLNGDIITSEKLVNVIVQECIDCIIEIIEEQNDEIYWSDEFYVNQWSLENVDKLVYNIKWLKNFVEECN